MRKHLVLALSVSSLFAVGLMSGAASADDPKPCVASSFEVAAVGAACKAGGQAAAKKLMKRAKKKAAELGEEFKCKGCHTDLKQYKLSSATAVADLKRYLK